MEVDSMLAVGDKFDDFASLLSKVKSIERSSGAVFSVHDSQTVAAVNKLTATNRQRVEPLTIRFKYKYVKCACQESGKICTTGKGERPHQRAADWKLDEPDWTGRLRVVANGKQLSIKLEDKNSGELFAECPVESYPGVAVESVLDSSRYFVIRIKDGSGRSAFIGIGFGDRGESFDLNVALQDHFKWLKQEEEAQKTMTDIQNGPKLDLGFKEGQTITLNIGTKKSSDSPSRSRTRPQTGGAGGIGLLPPPPGGLKIAPPPTSSNVQSEVVSQQSDVKNENCSASSSVDLLLDLGQSDNVPSTQEEQNPPDLWGDFTGAGSAAASSDNSTDSTNWVQF